jgi:hypothetical protein
VRSFEIWNADSFDSPDMVALFERAFADPKFGINPDDVREYLKLSIGTKESLDKVFVASDRKHGLCGLSIVTLGVYPLSPLPWVSHFVAERKGARESLLGLTLKAIRDAGYETFATHNATGASDAAYLRIFRRHMTGAVLGSLIVYELEKTNGGQ